MIAGRLLAGCGQVLRPAPLWLSAAGAWLVLAMPDDIAGHMDLCSSALIWSVPAPESFGFFFSLVPPSTLLLSWVTMLVAMQLPLLAGTLHHVRRTSFASLRLALQTLVLLGYLAVWIAGGVVLTGLAVTLRLAAGADVWSPALAALGLAVLWQVAPARQRALNRCHRFPAIAAFAPAAHLGALRLGLDRGVWCLASCGPLMLLALLMPSHPMGAMAVVALWLWAERLEPPARPAWAFRPPLRLLRALAWHIRTAADRRGT